MSLPRELSKLTIASLFATVVDGVAFFLVERFVVDAPVILGVAAACCAVLGGITHFLLCRHWVFQSDARWQSQAGKYVAASGTGALIHGTLVAGISTFTAGPIAWTFSKIFVYVAWTYPTSKWFVFSRGSR